MEHRVTNEDGDTDLVLVLGWGNRLEHQNVEWLVEQFEEANYRVHTFQIPDFVSDFYSGWVYPVRNYVADLDSFHLVGHSTGGLIAAYLDGAETTTYLSPWWGYTADFSDRTLDLVARLGIERRFIPSGISTPESIGQLATTQQLSDGPEKISPRFVRETRRGHRDRPAIDDDAVVFCTLRDRVVSTHAIGEAADVDQIVLYDGGHELFSSPCRTGYVDTLLAAVADGLAGVDERTRA
ncbi:alpha/beta fold hydrolase [Haloarchaeobius sp. DFWS5]|uniref:alpha/beta fold hydrolase n=1 Tax=Haloarchaeobius sp. DFWS5 TaxID=3446114 RepID=UPI003EBBE4C6